MRFTEENEPGVIKYCLTIPRDMEDKQSIFVIEEYVLPLPDSGLTTY